MQTLAMDAQLFMIKILGNNKYFHKGYVLANANVFLRRDKPSLFYFTNSAVARDTYDLISRFSLLNMNIASFFTETSDFGQSSLPSSIVLVNIFSLRGMCIIL